MRGTTWWPAAWRWRPSSVEDEGDGVSFHVYVYNVQPGVEIRLHHRRKLGERPSFLCAGGKPVQRRGGSQGLCAEYQLPQVPPSQLLLGGGYEREKPGGLPRHPGGASGPGLRALRQLQPLSLARRGKTWYTKENSIRVKIKTQSRPVVRAQPCCQ